MVTRSAQLAAGDVAAAGDTVIYTCPAGIRTIVKSVYLFDIGGGGIVNVSVLTAGSSTDKVLYWVTTGTALIVHKLDPLWTVLEEGDRLQVRLDSANGRFIASGAELIV